MKDKLYLRALYGLTAVSAAATIALFAFSATPAGMAMGWLTAVLSLLSLVSAELAGRRSQPELPWIVWGTRSLALFMAAMLFGALEWEILAFIAFSAGLIILWFTLLIGAAYMHRH